MNAKKHRAKKANLEQLDEAIPNLRNYSKRVDVVWFSLIHIRIHLDCGHVDFWPSTGSWYDPGTPLKGKGVGALVDHILGLLSPSKHKHLPPCPTVFPKWEKIENEQTGLGLPPFDEIFDAPIPQFDQSSPEEPPWEMPPPPNR